MQAMAHKRLAKSAAHNVLGQGPDVTFECVDFTPGSIPEDRSFTLEITVDVSNNSIETRVIQLLPAINNVTVDEQTVTLDPIETDTVTISTPMPAPVDAGAVNLDSPNLVTVFRRGTNQFKDCGTFQVTEPTTTPFETPEEGAEANIQVSLDLLADEVFPGEDVTVEIDAFNAGDAQGTEDVTLQVAGSPGPTISFDLLPGIRDIERVTVTVPETLAPGDIFAVSTNGAADSAAVVQRPAPETEEEARQREEEARRQEVSVFAGVPLIFVAAAVGGIAILLLLAAVL